MYCKVHTLLCGQDLDGVSMTAAPVHFPDSAHLSMSFIVPYSKAALIILAKSHNQSQSEIIHHLLLAVLQPLEMTH